MIYGTTEKWTYTPAGIALCPGTMSRPFMPQRDCSPSVDLLCFDDLLQCVLQKAGNWRFNAFTLETVTGGNYGKKLHLLGA